MQVTVTARGEPDAAPLVRIFRYDDAAFAAAAQATRDTLSCGLKTNINGALLLLAEHVMSSVREGLSAEQIRRRASDILSGSDVMIGVPEMLRMVDLEVVLDGRRHGISLSRPIPVPEDQDLWCR